MSGTSADGIDAALVELTGRRAELIAFRTLRYPPGLRRRVLALCEPDAPVAELCALNFALGERFARAALAVIQAAGLAPAEVHLVGSHGQTVRHDPRGARVGRRRVPGTLQIGEPAVIARRTGVVTVADFRPADIAAGGCGAPLVPLADWLLLGRPDRARATLNLGGVANVTFLPPGKPDAPPEGLLAFDTGPGNMVLDRLAERATAGRQSCDRGGRLARTGRVHKPTLRELMRHPFLRRRPPKSCGREEFGRAFADRLWEDTRTIPLSAADLLATATALTARSVAGAIRRHLPATPAQIVCSGGGVHNPALMRALADALPDSRVLSSAELGIDPDAREAVAFAVLAARTVRGLAGNVPAATGADTGAVLGKICLP
jgi:anhydro-N-acetylmuramic acid kinase